MFKSLKKAFGLGAAIPAPSAAGIAAFETGQPAADPLFLSTLSQWATARGYRLTSSGAANVVEGKIHGRPWRIEQGKPSRDFIHGLELRARGEMAVSEDAAVMVMTRTLKNELDKRAFSLYTDSLQTQVDPHLPQEMRWLAMYDEVGWESLGTELLDRYAILTDDRKNAMAWITPQIAEQLMTWPSAATDQPCVLMVARGKVYLRMQIGGFDWPIYEHASGLFAMACETALAAFSVDVSI
jgi:hypothetical protein